MKIRISHSLKSQRPTIIREMYGAATAAGIKWHTLFLAIDIFDRVSTVRQERDQSFNTALDTARGCLYLASKLYLDKNPPSVPTDIIYGVCIDLKMRLFRKTLDQQFDINKEDLFECLVNFTSVDSIERCTEERRQERSLRIGLYPPVKL